MPRGIVTRREDGSLPLAMLATIVVAGLITVVIARTIAGERAVRFDRNFGESLQVADVGINRGLFALNEGREDMLPTAGTPRIETVDGIDYEWWAEPSGAYREWQVTSEATANGVSRRVRATIEEVPLFFPGAFGDKLIALNGTSTDVDSYNSDPTCTAYTRECRWGSTTSDVYQQEFGTGNGSIGTNEDFDFSGNTTIRPGGAFLYDWEDNPGQGITVDDPFGDRCDGNPCTTTYTSTVPEKLDFATSARMEFITRKFESGGGCHNNSNPRQMGTWKLGAKNTTTSIVSYATSRGRTPDGTEPTDPDFENYYCAHSLEILGHLRLADSVTVDNPVVIFVKDYLTVPNSGTLVGCHNADASVWCSGTAVRRVTPAASRLQIYVAGMPHSGATAGDISMKSQTMFAGVVYAPLSRCGGGGGAGADVYGAIICGTMDNVGNWDFHYDDALGANGAGQFNIAFWQEVPPGS
jgi:hypothetical protein